MLLDKVDINWAGTRLYHIIPLRGIVALFVASSLLTITTTGLFRHLTLVLTISPYLGIIL